MGISPQQLPRTCASAKRPTATARTLSWPPPNPPSYRDVHLFVDLLQQAVTLDGETVTLTRMQYRILALLVEHAGVVVTRPILLLHIRGKVPELRPSKLDAHIRELRKRLGIYAGQYIETITGTGYRFRPSPSALAHRDAKDMPN